MLPPLQPLNELLLLHRDPPQYVIDKLLVRGGLSLLVAHPKAGKSTLVRNLMLQVSQGQTFFGRDSTQGTILYYAMEEPEVHILDEFRKHKRLIQNIHCRLGPIPKIQIPEVLRSDIHRLESTLAVIDPLFDALAVEDVNSYAKVNEAMKELLHVARDTGCHILTVHHTNKADLRGGLSVLGSQALAGATDCNMFLTLRRDGVRLFESQPRVGEPIELTAIGFDKVTHAIWLEKTAKEEKSEAMAEELLKTLGDKAMTLTDLRSRVKGRHSEKAEVMERLEKEGRVTRQHIGRQTVWSITAPSRVSQSVGCTTQ